MKLDYGCEVKQQARARLKIFIERFYSKRSRRKQLKVLTLLGPEPHELAQIWDPLGILRENITVVEKEPKIHAMIDAQKLGVRLLPSITIHEHCSKTDDTYDVINIDETSNFGLLQRHCIKAISYRHVLAPKGILATWYLGQRESGYTSQWFRARNTLAEKQMTIEDRSRIPLDEICANDRWTSEREKFISKELAGMMIDGLMNFGEHPFLNISEFKRYHESRIKPIAEASLHQDPRGLTLEEAMTGCRVAPSVILDSVRNYLRLLILSPQIPENSRTHAIEILSYTRTGSYAIDARERYSYISDTGAVMLLDFARYHALVLQGFSIGTHPLTNEPQITADPKMLATQLQQYNLLERARTIGSTCPDERVHLGSSRKYTSATQNRPQHDQTIDTLTKDSAISLLKGGVTAREILDAYPGQFTRQQLAAYKAHITMGTYAKISE